MAKGVNKFIELKNLGQNKRHPCKYTSQSGNQIVRDEGEGNEYTCFWINKKIIKFQVVNCLIWQLAFVYPRCY